MNITYNSTRFVCEAAQSLDWFGISSVLLLRIVTPTNASIML